MKRASDRRAGGQAIRCAIYTRKSTDHGTMSTRAGPASPTDKRDLEFNSLDAQRETCEAYIKSRASEGWQVIPDQYHDPAYSGGNMDRPALQRILKDIEAGLVDVVVVYKIDPLTRSLADFAKLVEVFDARKVSFVAVTQQFNTTTSMGRLTLNVLLSFAHFERELASERVKDKVAASRKKGKWTGGSIPLGYDAIAKKLVVNPVEAETVRIQHQKKTTRSSSPSCMPSPGRIIGWKFCPTARSTASKRWQPMNRFTQRRGHPKAVAEYPRKALHQCTGLIAVGSVRRPRAAKLICSRASSPTRWPNNCDNRCGRKIDRVPASRRPHAVRKIVMRTAPSPSANLLGLGPNCATISLGKASTRIRTLFRCRSGIPGRYRNSAW